MHLSECLSKLDALNTQYEQGNIEYKEYIKEFYPLVKEVHNIYAAYARVMGIPYVNPINIIPYKEKP